VALVVFLNITRIASIYPVLAAAEIPLLLTGLSGVVIAAQATRWKPRDLTRHWIPKLVMVVLLFAILGIPLALHRYASFKFLTHDFAQSLLGGVLVFGVARTAVGRRLMAKTLVISGLVTGLLAVLYSKSDSSGRLRGAATYDPNDLALIIVMTLPLLIWWFFDNKSKLRWIAIVALPMMFSVILRTDSRGGFLGMVAILAGLIFVGMTGRVREVRRIAMTGIALATIGFLALPATYMERMSTMGEEIDNKSPTGRISVWKRGMGYAFDNPLLGVGIGNFGRAEGILSEYSQSKDGRGVKWSTAHSSYVEAWATIGLIGGTAFILVILRATFALMLWRPPQSLRDPAQRMLAPMLGLTLAAFAVGGAFLSWAFMSPPYYLLGFGTALLLVAANDPGPSDASPARKGMPQRGARMPAYRPLSRFPAPPPRPVHPRP
jgi:O-antigen ligase